MMAFQGIHESLYHWSNLIWPAVVTHLLEATLFLAFAVIAATLLRRAPGRARYCVWLIAIAKFALPSVLLVLFAARVGVDLSVVNRLFHGRVSKIAVTASPNLETTRSSDLTTTSSATASSVKTHSETYCAMSVIWLIGFLAVLGLWCRWRLKFSAAIKAGRAVNAGREVEALAAGHETLGIRRNIRLMLSGQVNAPAVCGVFKPVIVLPEGLADCLSADELKSVLMHELVHVRHWDNLASNLQMVVCSLFWFHPLLWLVDRRLIDERERTCDAVVSLLSDPKTYASSILKLCQLCIGLNVAGVSRATGANMKGRIEAIMSTNTHKRSSGFHRILVGSTLLWLVVFSVLVGVLNNQSIIAQTKTNAPVATPRPPVEISESESSNLVTPRADGDKGLTTQQFQDLQTRVSRTPETAIRTENPEGGPIHISSATVRIVRFDGEANEVLITPPVMSLINNTSKRIDKVRVELSAERKFNDSVGFEISIEPYGSYLLQPQWSKWTNTIKSIRASDLVARIIGVRFDDGSAWGSADLTNYDKTMKPPVDDPREAPPAASPKSPRENNESTPDPVGVEYVAAKFVNAAGAPLVITEAKTRTDAPPRNQSDEAVYGSGPVSYLPTVTLTNNSDRRITGLKLRFKADPISHAVSGIVVSIEPHSSFTYSRHSTMAGKPEDMMVQVLGVQFEDDYIWGSMDSQINGRDYLIDVPTSIRRDPNANNSSLHFTPIAPRELSSTPRPKGTPR